MLEALARRDQTAILGVVSRYEVINAKGASKSDDEIVDETLTRVTQLWKKGLLDRLDHHGILRVFSEEHEGWICDVLRELDRGCPPWEALDQYGVRTAVADGVRRACSQYPWMNTFERHEQTFFEETLSATYLWMADDDKLARILVKHVLRLLLGKTSEVAPIVRSSAYHRAKDLIFATQRDPILVGDHVLVGVPDLPWKSPREAWERTLGSGFLEAARNLARDNTWTATALAQWTLMRGVTRRAAFGPDGRPHVTLDELVEQQGRTKKALQVAYLRRHRRVLRRLAAMCAPAELVAAEEREALEGLRRARRAGFLTPNETALLAYWSGATVQMSGIELRNLAGPGPWLEEPMRWEDLAEALDLTDGRGRGKLIDNAAEKLHRFWELM